MTMNLKLYINLPIFSTLTPYPIEPNPLQNYESDLRERPTMSPNEIWLKFMSGGGLLRNNTSGALSQRNENCSRQCCRWNIPWMAENKLKDTMQIISVLLTLWITKLYHQQDIQFLKPTQRQISEIFLKRIISWIRCSRPKTTVPPTSH